MCIKAEKSRCYRIGLKFWNRRLIGNFPIAIAQLGSVYQALVYLNVQDNYDKAHNNVEIFFSTN